MAWYRNYYQCARCGYEWPDEWSCTCEDDCPRCGARHMTPYQSDDLTEVIERDGEVFIALRSAESAEDHPAYSELGRFPTEAAAKAVFVSG